LGQSFNRLSDTRPESIDVKPSFIQYRWSEPTLLLKHRRQQVLNVDLLIAIAQRNTLGSGDCLLRSLGQSVYVHLTPSKTLQNPVLSNSRKNPAEGGTPNTSVILQISGLQTSASRLLRCELTFWRAGSQSRAAAPLFCRQGPLSSRGSRYSFPSLASG